MSGIKRPRVFRRMPTLGQDAPEPPRDEPERADAVADALQETNLLLRALADADRRNTEGLAAQLAATTQQLRGLVQQQQRLVSLQSGLQSDLSSLAAQQAAQQAEAAAQQLPGADVLMRPGIDDVCRQLQEVAETIMPEDFIELLQRLSTQVAQLQYRLSVPGLPLTLDLEDEYHHLRWIIRKWDDQTIPANTNVPLLDLTDENGFVGYLRLVLDSPQPRLRIETEQQVWRASIEQLGPWGWGVTQANPFAWWVPMYNTEDDVYVMMWTPTPPYPYKQSLNITVENTTSVAVTVDDSEIARWTTRR